LTQRIGELEERVDFAERLHARANGWDQPTTSRKTPTASTPRSWLLLPESLVQHPSKAPQFLLV
jgi:hypothetical protein